MASTYTDLGIELMATGENAGTWGTKTNANLNLIEQLTGGFATLSIAGGAGTQALTIADGALTGTAQQRVIEFTGSITGNRIITIPNDVETFYILKNSTSGAYTVQFKYATGSGSSTTFSSTDKGIKIVYASASPDATNPNIVDIMATSSEISLANNNPVKFLDADNSASVGIKAPSTVSGTYTLTLPAGVGSTDQALVTTDGSGTLGFTSTSTFGISTGKSIAMAIVFG
jgi:hypothetical protein|tara:strand:+ start:299 stop:988 length:690 start_codon:yes stop_codon:yes gene_type:complete